MFCFNDAHLITIPLATNNQCSPLECLIINHRCSLNELESLTSYTPELRRLTVHQTDPNITTLQSITLINLMFIYLHMCEISFYELATFLINISTSLKILSINSSNDITYLDAHRWEILILNYPQLEKFYFTYHDRMDNNKQYQIYSGPVNPFFTSFWIQHKWIFKVEIEAINIKYVIYPYKKRWYDNLEDGSTNDCIKYSTFNCLTFACIVDFTFDEWVSKRIQRILTITKIYHLEILEEHILFGILIRLVYQLPELMTIKLHSLTLDKKIVMYDYEHTHSSSIKRQIHINKVYLQVLNTMEEFDSIMELCPLTMYLKVGFINNIKVELFVRNILEKIHDKCNDHLRVLCCHVPAADDKMIDYLHEMIQREQLLDEFTMKRVNDLAYVQWT